MCKENPVFEYEGQVWTGCGILLEDGSTLEEALMADLFSPTASEGIVSQTEQGYVRIRVERLPEVEEHTDDGCGCCVDCGCSEKPIGFMVTGLEPEEARHFLQLLVRIANKRTPGSSSGIGKKGR